MNLINKESSEQNCRTITQDVKNELCFPKIDILLSANQSFCWFGNTLPVKYRNSKPRGPAHAWYHYKYNGISKSVDNVGFVCDALVLAVGILS